MIRTQDVALGRAGPGAALGRTGLGVVVAVAASAVLPLVMGPVRDGTVLGVFSSAVIVGVDTDAGPRVVSLLGRAAAGVPNGVRLAGPLPTDVVALRAGTGVGVGGGGIGIGHGHVRVVRSWRSDVHPIRPDQAGVAVLHQAAESAERGVPLPPIGALADALTATGAVPDELDAAVGELVGRGRGLTPGGDDVLAGLVIGLRAGGSTDLASRVGDRALHRITERTTLLSADLVRLAAVGQAGTEALAVLRAIHRPGSGVANASATAGGRLTASIEALLSVGHTSGADLATGLAMGLKFAMSAIDRGDPMTATRLETR